MLGRHMSASLAALLFQIPSPSLVCVTSPALPQLKHTLACLCCVGASASPTVGYAARGVSHIVTEKRCADDKSKKMNLKAILQFLFYLEIAHDCRVKHYRQTSVVACRFPS